MNEFKSYHPIVNFTYFGLVIVFSMCFLHPVSLGISLVCGFIYSILLKGKKAVKFNLIFLLPMVIAAALFNPAFNHEGITILAYFPNGNPLTMESIAYGLAAAAMIAAVICWFSCYNEIMTCDKFIYLFGRIMPAMSLILSMALRFVPVFKEQFRAVSDAQKCIGRDFSSGGPMKRLKCAITIFSIMVTWALENAIEKADSMRSRGYGLPGRTAFSIFRFDKRDAAAMLWLTLTGVYVIVAAFCGGMYFRYFPSIKTGDNALYSISVFAAYFGLCITPVVIEIWEDRKWRI